jgi:predicted tellurium resistance membrane protein TerC
MGGIFLMAKATHEIHNSLEGIEDQESQPVTPSFGMVLVQITLLDVVFSLDSVITAIGLVDLCVCDGHSDHRRRAGHAGCCQRHRGLCGPASHD